MTNADDRATLETLGRVLTVLWEHDADKIPNLLDRRAVTYRDPAGCLAALRSALQVPDAAQAPTSRAMDHAWRAEAVAQARREAIEECIEALWEIGAGRPERHADNFVTGAIEMRRTAEGRIRALAAQPAARGEEEHEQRVSSRESAAAPEKAAQDGDSGEAPMQTTSINPGSTPGAPTSPPPDDAAAFSGWKPNAQELARMREAMRPTQPPASEAEPDERELLIAHETCMKLGYTVAAAGVSAALAQLRDRAKEAK